MRQLVLAPTAAILLAVALPIASRPNPLPPKPLAVVCQGPTVERLEQRLPRHVSWSDEAGEYRRFSSPETT